MTANRLAKITEEVCAIEEAERVKIINRIRYVGILLIAIPVILTSIQSNNLNGIIVNSNMVHN